MNAFKKMSRYAGFDAIVAPIKPRLNELDAYVDAQVSDFEVEIQDLVRYCMASQGKRIRATLTFLSAWGGPREASEDVIRVAAVIELVHLATLVHDDILDEATLRRSRPTADKKYGSKIAVLLGDALFSHALKLASDFSSTEVCQAVARATRQVCTGEIEQIFHRGNANLSLEAYYRVIQLKTAELFEVACALGAKLGGHPKDYVQSVAEFGRHLGVAYQIFDDWADLAGDEDYIGKTLGTDLATGKYTLPLLLLVQEMRKGGDDRVNLLISGVLDVDLLRGLLLDYEVEEAVRVHFFQELERGERLLQELSGNTPKSPLVSLLSFFKPLMDKYSLSKTQSI